MRKLIGHLVAVDGAERAVARKFVQSFPQFLCNAFLFNRFPSEQIACARAGGDLVPASGIWAGLDLRGEARTGEPAMIGGAGASAGAVLPGRDALA